MKPIDKFSDDEWLALVQRAIAMPDAPQQLVRDALELWRLHRPPTHFQPSLQRWFAVLSFDSWAAATPTAAGMRALPSEARQMLFSAERFEIDLRIAPLAGAFELSGQLFGPAADGSVELATPADGEEPSLRSVTLDPSSEFRIEGVTRGPHRVTLRVGSDEIVLPPVDVGLPRDASGS
jgi:hypothetical protein